MLKKVFFLWGRKTRNRLGEQIAPLFLDLAKHRVKVADVVLEEIAEKESARKNDEIPVCDKLYITDDAAKYFLLKAGGRYVLPYLHEENKGDFFGGARYVIEKIEEMDFEAVDMAYRRLAGLPWEILTTDRCIVRETTVEDVEKFYEIYAAPSITKYMDNLSADKEEEKAYTRDYIENIYGFYGYGMWTVLKKDGEVIGRAGITWREGFDVPELGFMIGEQWQRQGYAFEACSAILAYAKEELGFVQIQTLVMKGNEKSKNLCAKLGFKPTEDIVLGKNVYVRYLMIYQ